MPDDLEDFLRQAAQRRRNKPLENRPPARKLPVREEVIDVEIVEAEPADSISQYVAEHLSSTDITEHSTHLAENIEQADERVEARLHEKFDRHIGQLEHAETEQEPYEKRAAGPETADFAKELMQLFQSPQSIRQAIILQEILARPEHRW